jgi:hypothetical protein
MAKDAVPGNGGDVRGFVLALCAELKEEVRMGIARRNQDCVSRRFLPG